MTAKISKKLAKNLWIEAQKLNSTNPFGKGENSVKKAVEHLESGLRNFNLKYYDDAIADLSEAIKKDKNFVEAYFILGDLYAENEKFDRAIENYKIGISINPEFYKQ